jgi:hypothetical protein
MCKAPKADLLHSTTGAKSCVSLVGCELCGQGWFPDGTPHPFHNTADLEGKQLPTFCGQMRMWDNIVVPKPECKECDVLTDVMIYMMHGANGCPTSTPK